MKNGFCVISNQSGGTLVARSFRKTQVQAEALAGSLDEINQRRIARCERVGQDGGVATTYFIAQVVSVIGPKPVPVTTIKPEEFEAEIDGTFANGS